MATARSPPPGDLSESAPDLASCRSCSIKLSRTRALVALTSARRPRNGILSYKEMKHALKKLCPLSHKAVRAVFNFFDSDRDGEISYEEFVTVLESDWDTFGILFES